MCYTTVLRIGSLLSEKIHRSRITGSDILHHAVADHGIAGTSWIIWWFTVIWKRFC